MKPIRQSDVHRQQGKITILQGLHLEIYYNNTSTIHNRNTRSCLLYLSLSLKGYMHVIFKVKSFLMTQKMLVRNTGLSS